MLLKRSLSMSELIETTIMVLLALVESKENCE